MIISSKYHITDTVWTSRCTARWPLRHAGLPDNYLQTNVTKNEAFSLVKYITPYVQNGPLITLVLVWRKLIHFWRRYMQTTIFIFSVPVTSTSLDLKFTLLVTLVECFVSTKLQFLRLSYFEKIGGTGRTDRQTVCSTWCGLLRRVA